LAAGSENVALVARRQGPASQPCNYFWITDTIALDGLVRSDNRGSESVFPLYLVEDSSRDSSDVSVRRGRLCASAAPSRPNFSAHFVDRLARQLDLTWLADAGPTTGDPFTAGELCGYIYALLHAPSYRQRFATWLRIDFPRVFVPARTSLFRNLSRLGARLIDLHLLRGDPPLHASFEGSWAAARVGAGFPQWAPHRIYVNRDLSIGPVPRQVWEFRVGAYQVCQKWLKDRRGRDLQPADLHHFGRIVAAIENTLESMRQIDQEIDRHGGWHAAFV
jgi:hypothetical protein